MEGINLQSGFRPTAGTGQIQNQYRVQSQLRQSEASDFSESLTAAAAPAASTVLNQNEMATLHMLFGSEKPVEQNFYGQKNAPQIHVGHLVDISG